MTALQGCARFLQVSRFGVPAAVAPLRVAFARGCDLDQPPCNRVPGGIKVLAMVRQPKTAACTERPASPRACRHPSDVVSKRTFRERTCNFVERERASLDVVSRVETKSIRHWRRHGCNDGLIRLRLLLRRSDIQTLAVAQPASGFQGKWRKALLQSKY
jgi:hypothetical protein